MASTHGAMVSLLLLSFVVWNLRVDLTAAEESYKKEVEAIGNCLIRLGRLPSNQLRSTFNISQINSHCQIWQTVYSIEKYVH